jgi:hypothetical protein
MAAASPAISRPVWFGWAKNNFTWQINVGNGMGRYLSGGS